MKIGDVVIPREGFTLFSGYQIYPYAICVSEDPFVLVSGQGDMLWTQIDMANVTGLCPASEEIVGAAKARYARYCKEKGICDEPVVCESVKTVQGETELPDVLQLPYTTERISEKLVGDALYTTERTTFYEGSGRVVEIECVYCAKSGKYFGLAADYESLIKKGITEGFDSAVPNSNRVAIGFNPKENKWYGWSHRAIFGFGVGSTVKFGDCGYKPTDKYDLQRETEQFWDIGVERPVSDDGKTCKSVVISMEHDVDDPYGIEGIGLLMKKETYFNYERSSFASTIFVPYPKSWGRGEWTAETLEDARQMAIDFAQGVN